MAPRRTFILGTRGSGLAMRQTQEVLEQLQAANPDSPFQVVTVATGGDKRPEDPIATLGLGAFVKELEMALLRGEIDLAVHSLKDMPTEQHPDLMLAAVTKREDPRDTLVDRWDLPLEELPRGARIGTGSPRRASQLLHLRPDLQVLDIRGNVDTRLSKARGQDFDGVVLAMAGLRRLGREKEAAEVFSPEVMVPAPGQGALALQVREGDEELAGILRGIGHADTALAVTAERGLLQALGGGCRIPFGAYATVTGSTLTLTGMLAAETGTQVYRASPSGGVGDVPQVIRETYQQLREQGATLLLMPSGGM